jgi:Na+/H+-dicarboxylate symporter
VELQEKITNIILATMMIAVFLAIMESTGRQEMEGMEAVLKCMLHLLLAIHLTSSWLTLVGRLVWEERCGC